MKDYHWVIIGSYSIALAAIIGLIRLRKVSRAYQPFIFITVVSFVMEIISTILIQFHQNNAPATHLSSLAECMLWLWQFRNWGAFGRYPRQLHFIAGILGLAWVTEHILLGKFFVFSSCFSLAFSFTVVFLAINQVNQLIVQERRNLLLNARFLICTGAIIFYTYRIMVESFYLYDLNEANAFLVNVFKILVFVNLFVNLLFAFAMIWVPRRQRFTLPY